MTVTQLECFLAVARSSHFGRAAENLRRTQPALSVQVQRLEAELGTALFDRSARKVRLTSAGEILLPYAERILADVDESRAKILDAKGGNLGVLRIGVLPTVAAHFLPAVMAVFKARCPDVSVSLREESRTEQLIPLLQSGEIDLSIARRPIAHAGLKSHAVLTEELCLAVSRKHPLARADSVAPSQLRSERFILYKSPLHSTRELTLQFCRSAGFEPKVEFESEQAQTIQNLVAANLGITLLPEMVLRNHNGLELVMVRIQPPAPTRTLVVSWKAGHYLSATVRKFLTIAEKVGRQWQRQR
jgi:DNA-binding transcriptional LysR family regulator